MKLAQKKKEKKRGKVKGLKLRLHVATAAEKKK